MKIPESIELKIEEKENKETLLKVMEIILNEYEKEDIISTDLQYDILLNHLNEMIIRSKSGIKIPSVDAEMFSEVSANSIDLSKRIVEQIGNLPTDEIYVLSIHFETSRQNIKED
ncbi:PRD domain protein EF_0829/AHA_3910 [Granulicatella balaenopterae]|uniref:PRD domain protein EF_0829/AHA_3910 n=1 Tax=Granulicatella balaenopterae TaxID=137733 RepID=A0A1H9NVY4_9LACT|nr:PRD domain-containing protein [Granulicatella balaenopterae]SER40110.1 PRD domain protein EF_0829/AHA_3910 [Granulicatella balaenopterae]